MRPLARLYARSSKVFYSLLPVFARHVVMALLWHDSPTSISQIEVLFRKAEGKRSAMFGTFCNPITLITCARQLEIALAALTRLHILSIVEDDLSFDDSFRTHFRQALTGGWADLRIRESAANSNTADSTSPSVSLLSKLILTRSLSTSWIRMRLINGKYALLVCRAGNII